MKSTWQEFDQSMQDAGAVDADAFGNPWGPMESAPMDGTQVLLAFVDDDGSSWGVRQGFYEPAFASRQWYDIDGEEIAPQFWMPLPPPPPGAR